MFHPRKSWADLLRKKGLNYDFHHQERIDRIQEAVGEKNATFLDGTAAATALIGDLIATNIFMMGAAYQKGLIPLQASSIEEVIRLNNVSVEDNLRAFTWGRLSISNPEILKEIIAKVAPKKIFPKTLKEVVEHRKLHLEKYQNAAYAKRYEDFVAKCVREESKIYASKQDLSLVVAKNYAKLLAYKDEDEVARLFSDEAFRNSLDKNFEKGYRLRFHLSPPSVALKDRRTGLPKKAVYGAWMMGAFRILSKFKGLRGSAFDIFGYQGERKLERRLIQDYEQDVERILKGLSKDNYEQVMAFLSWPDQGHQDEKKRLGTIEMAPIDAKKGRDYKSVQQDADQVLVYGEENVQRLYDETLKIFLKVVQDNPKAVILLPTGSTPKPFYKKLIAAFKADPKLDLSGVAFFNLDEYVGLPAVHPLSYHYYMEKNLYGPLLSIDSNRAPRKTDTYIPQVTPGVSPEISIRAYGELFRQTVACRGGLDLAILGVGGAYPVRHKDGSLGIKGGHIAFNEPGSKVSQTAHLVQLTEKTRKDTAHRFKSLENLVRLGVLDASLSTEVPTHALTLGLKEILQADKILLLAVGEEKAPVLEKAFLSPRNSDFPVSFLVGSPKVLWLLDESASARLPDFVRTQDYYTSIPKGRLSETVKQAVTKTDQLFPKGENVLILSPHPDDDVISMGAAIEHLKQRDCTVHVAYAVTGANATSRMGTTARKARVSNKRQGGVACLQSPRKGELVACSGPWQRSDTCAGKLKLTELVVQSHGYHGAQSARLKQKAGRRGMPAKSERTRAGGMFRPLAKIRYLGREAKTH
uniref:Glucosamine-6-phosphate deaminase n=1 Tax=Stylophora pistillata TaxID=50429 RepID=A0A2B4R5F9_STYPI